MKFYIMYFDDDDDKNILSQHTTPLLEIHSDENFFDRYMITKIDISTYL